ALQQRCAEGGAMARGAEQRRHGVRREWLPRAHGIRGRTKATAWPAQLVEPDASPARYAGTTPRGGRSARHVKLSLVLHAHQPPGNYDSVFQRAIDTCYGPVLDLIEERPTL